MKYDIYIMDNSGCPRSSSSYCFFWAYPNLYKSFLECYIISQCLKLFSVKYLESNNIHDLTHYHLIKSKCKYSKLNNYSFRKTKVIS